MTRWRVLLATAVVMALGVATIVGVLTYRRVAGIDRPDRETPEVIRRQIATLESERMALRARLDALVTDDPRMIGMPDTPVRVAVPTTLVRTLVERVLDGAARRVTLELRDIRVRRTGSVRRTVTLGDYDLDINVDRVTGTLTAGQPSLTFGSNRIGLALPVTVASGQGRATVRFVWDGRRLGGAVCGDMTVTETVTGDVVPRTYRLQGALQVSATDRQIIVQPRLPRLGIHIDVAPSPAAWAAMQKILDDKRGLCGFIIDRVDIIGAVKKIVDKGFDVRLPTEKVSAVALPVGIEPTMVVAGEPVALGIRVGGLTITEHVLWLGAHVSVTIGEAATAKPAAGK